MNQKFELTKYLLGHLGKDTSIKNIKKYIPVFWVNPRIKDKGGLRLTQQGFEALLSADIKSYELKFEDPIFWTNELVIWIDQNLDCPFYITNQKIWVFGEKMAVQLVLFSGNIQKFYRAKKRSQQKDKSIDKIS